MLYKKPNTNNEIPTKGVELPAKPLIKTNMHKVGNRKGKTQKINCFKTLHTPHMNSFSSP